jgi:serine/threonine protein kinase
LHCINKIKDCKWWQGLDASSGNSPISLLNGIDVTQLAAMKLAEKMDAISSARSGDQSVRLLNFAYITLDKSKLLGAGSFSKVYKGSYRNEVCAIKLIFTIDLTVDVINRVAAEASILSKIRDPNIVKILGVSVLPPSVCILLEFCSFGSLADLCKGTRPTPTGNTVGPAMVLLHDADKFYLALGCAKGLAALHSHGPDMVHRDIKSFNFLVDHQLNCKLADLELGSESTRRKSAKTAGAADGIVSAFNINSNRASERRSDLER